jgi:type II secretory pathway component HofQ
VRAQELEIIDLDFRLADELLPILRPLVEPGGVLTGTDDVLFLRASPDNVAQIRAAVASLDRPPRQLLITVGQGTVREVDAARAEGEVTIGGDDVHVGINRPPGTDSGAQLRVRARRQEADLHNVSSVRATEGIETWIGTGVSVPLTETRVRQDGIVQQSTSYRDVSTGFYATARLSGDRVVLDVSSRQQRYRPGSGVVDTQGATTTVTATLGEWFELGAVEQSAAASTGGLLIWGRRDATSDHSVWVKVEEP